MLSEKMRNTKNENAHNASRKCSRAELKNLVKDTPDDTLNLKNQNRPQFLQSHANAYFYDPKTKQQMKYYDRFPLIMCVQMYNNGLGLNFHYLPPMLRATTQFR